MPLPTLEAPEDLTVDKIEPIAVAVQYDLECMFWESPEGLQVNLIYNSDLFEASTIL